MMSREKFEWLIEIHDQYKGNARHQQKIIDKLSRKIQKLKKENRKLKDRSEFSYNLLISIVNMLNNLGMKAEIEKKFDKYSLLDLAILKVHNPNNNLYACIKINEDLLEGGKK